MTTYKRHSYSQCIKTYIVNSEIICMHLLLGFGDPLKKCVFIFLRSGEVAKNVMTMNYYSAIVKILLNVCRL